MDGWWDTAEEGCRERGVGDTMEGTLGQEHFGGGGGTTQSQGYSRWRGGGRHNRGMDTVGGGGMTQRRGPRDKVSGRGGGDTGKREWGGLQRGPRNVGGGAGGQQRGDYPGTRDGGWGGRRGVGTPQGGNSRRDPGMRERGGHGGGYPGAGGWGDGGGQEQWGGPHRGQPEAAHGTAPVVDVICVPEVQPTRLSENGADGSG